MKQILLINKPKHYTSNNVLQVLKRVTNRKKIGHAGTLDPIAQGLLIICIGRENTKHIQDFVDLSKTYQATINLTATSATDDAEGPLTPVDIAHIPTVENIHEVLQAFIGTQLQTPPIFSAIKIDGVRCYKRARKNQTVKIDPRTITIHEISLLNYSWPELTIKVHCSKGTYIRSLARDIGAALQTGGYLSDLIRTRIGDFDIAQSICLTTITQLEESHFLTIP